MHFTTSPNGWTNNDLGLTWLEQVFDRRSKLKARRRWRLSILDGHDSHVVILTQLMSSPSNGSSSAMDRANEVYLRHVKTEKQQGKRTDRESVNADSNPRLILYGDEHRSV